MVVSSNISVSDLVEFLTKAFAVIDKWDDSVQDVFVIFTFPILEFESWFIWFWCRVCLNFQWRTVCQVNSVTSLFTFLVIICQRHIIVYLAVLNTHNCNFCCYRKPNGKVLEYTKCSFKSSSEYCCVEPLFKS